MAIENLKNVSFREVQDNLFGQKTSWNPSWVHFAGYVPKNPKILVYNQTFFPKLYKKIN